MGPEFQPIPGAEGWQRIRPGLDEKLKLAIDLLDEDLGVADICECVAVTRDKGVLRKGESGDDARDVDLPEARDVEVLRLEVDREGSGH